MDSLRLLVGRGGDPEKYDNYGNTALHLAAARGHMNCVTFLINFGVNMWVLDIDMHTPKELASMNDCTDILQYLDAVASKQELEDPKKMKKQMEQAEKNAQKLIKNFATIQKKAQKEMLKSDRELEREIERMTVDSSISAPKREAQQKLNNSQTFSDMVGVSTNGTVNSVRTKKIMGTVFKKASARKTRIQDDTFKVRDLEDGKQTVRHLSGLRRDSEIMFGPPKNGNTNVNENEGSISAASFGQNKRDAIGVLQRPGFGSLAFRKPAMAVLDSMQSSNGSIGSTGDLASHSNSLGDDELEQDSINGEEDSLEIMSAIDLMLTNLGLSQYMKIFRKQKIDIEALMLLDEQSLVEMNIEIGPRKKIMRAIQERRELLESDLAIVDSRM